MIEIAIGFVTQTLAQIPFTIEATSLIVPLALCMYMHRSTLVCIYIYIDTDNLVPGESGIPEKMSLGG